MAVAVMVDIPDGYQPVYEQLTARLSQDGNSPRAGRCTWPAQADGWRIINVVPPQEQFEAFARAKLFFPPSSKPRRNTIVHVFSP